MAVRGSADDGPAGPRGARGSFGDRPHVGQRRLAALAVEKLTKRFGDRVAFEDVSFEVGYGEVFGFLGPNGAGKTTTVRTLGTLIAPTSGSATVAGIPLGEENGPAIRARISIMPESPGLYLRLTVMENLRASPGSTSSTTFPGGSSVRCGRSTSSTARAILQVAVEGPAPAGRARPSAPQRPGGAVPRRADLGARPGRHTRGPRADRLASRARGHDLSHHAPARGGRAAVRPGGDPEHDAAIDRPARRAARAAVHEIPGRAASRAA